MSPDDVFAGQMWTWPEPVIKRDAMGRVLFVNAAFLQLYGGTIDQWRGNVVQGWANPQAPGQCHRFETRQPTPQGEQVYDWVEYSMADGSSMTLARNITHFLAPADPPPGSQAPVPQDQVQATQPPAHQAPQEQPAQAAFAQAEPVAEAPAAEQTAEAISEYSAEEYSGPAQIISERLTPTEPEPAIQAEPDAAPAGHMAPEPQTPEEPVFQAPPAPVNEAPSTPVQTAQPPSAAPAAVAPAVAPPAATAQPAAPGNAPLNPDGRDFERRALPIEDGDAVLGNNWRDAVIAKAVGVEQYEAATETAQEEAAPAVDNGGNPGDITKTRILLAEDNAINALLTRTLLEAEGCHVETVEDGLLAVEAMKNNSFDLIFMDMRMPNMDGLEATRKIRTLPNVSKDLPIIALTANAFDDDRNACFDSGMNDFMTKPVSAEELSEMVRNWTQREEEAIAS